MYPRRTKRYPQLCRPAPLRPVAPLFALQVVCSYPPRQKAQQRTNGEQRKAEVSPHSAVATGAGIGIHGSYCGTIDQGSLGYRY
jgi:hypothetical protein